ncbi:MAG: hypothetical protein Kow0081_1820 [Candidatus Dojkabacteria bacterium]
MALKKNVDSKNLEGSPLIKKGTQESPLHSTIHPERFDMSRFSERRDEEESSFRIILYVIIVIIIGVGLALLVRFLISKQTEESNENNNTDTEQEAQTVDSAVEINSTAKPDPSNSPRDGEYSTQPLVVVGATSASTDGISVSKLTFDSFVTFSRIRLAIDGVSPSATLPQFEIAFSSENKQMKVSIPQGVRIADDIKSNILVNSTLINDISFNAAENALVINLTRDARYLVDASPSTINLYFKSDALFVEGENSSSDEPAESAPDETDINGETNEPTGQNNTNNENNNQKQRPTGINYDNEFSRNKQFVTSNVTSNSIEFTETFFEDAGSFFEIGWGKVGNVGDNYVPNATAELVEEDGIYYIVVEIDNIAKANVSKTIDQTDIPFSLAGANFVQSVMETNENGKVVFKIELKRAADFKIATVQTPNQDTQVLVVQIKD